MEEQVVPLQKELCKAMAEAFSDIQVAITDSVNPHFKSKYANLASIVAAIKPALKDRGLWFMQKVHSTPGFASVETIIFHSSGESLSCGITSIPVLKADAQGYGSALTYSKRYSLSSAFSVSAGEAEDDDGNAACEKPKEKKAFSPASFEIESTPERATLNNQQLSILAMTTLKRLGLDISEYDSMVACLAAWQEVVKNPIGEIVTSQMKDKSKFLETFDRWKAKNSKKAVEVGRNE